MKGFRTLAFNAVAMALPIIELTEFRDVIPDNYLPWYALTVALANIWLRSVTTTPIGTK